MKCVNTDWDHELIKRLKRGRSPRKSLTRHDRPTGRGDRTASPVVATRNAGRWTMEQRLAQKAAKEVEKRSVVQSAVNETCNSSMVPLSEVVKTPKQSTAPEDMKHPNLPPQPVESDKPKLFESPFWKIRMEIMESKNQNLGNGKSLDNQGFRKKMKILDDRAGEMKKILTPPRRPHQDLPPVKKLTETLEPPPKPIEVIAEKPKTPKQSNMEDVLQKRTPRKEPNFIDFSALSMGVWSDIRAVEHGETIPILMKSMKTQHWEKIIKYYGVFERAGRLDRGILYELARDLGDKLLEHPMYKEVIRSLDQDPNEGLYLLGKIMMNIYHIIAVQSGNSGRSLTVQEITSKLDSGYKNIMKTKKEDDVRTTMRSGFKGK